MRASELATLQQVARSVWLVICTYVNVIQTAKNLKNNTNILQCCLEVTTLGLLFETKRKIVNSEFKCTRSQACKLLKCVQYNENGRKWNVFLGSALELEFPT